MVASKHSPPIYFTSLELENVRCFGGRRELKLTDSSGNLTQWTLLLGENGVGKTTLLECLAWMRPVPVIFRESTTQVDDETDEPPPLKKGLLGPALPNEENEVLEGLLRFGAGVELELNAKLSLDKGFVLINGGKKSRKGNKGKQINTSIRISYTKSGLLKAIKRERRTRIEKTLGEFPEPLFIAYGANRQLGWQNLSQSDLDDPIASRLSGLTELYDAEEILNRLDHAAAKKGYKGIENNRLEKVKKMLIQILPEIQSIEVLPPKILDSAKPSGVRFKIFSADVPLSALSFGYKTTLAWVVDLAWRLFRRYPKSSNPLAEPAVVLIDEIDLHLHPLWQLTIMDDLSQIFPRVQFIATAHSPLMVQSAPNANIEVIQKKGDEIIIINEPHVVRSWRVDQILNSRLFGVPNSRDKDTEKLFEERKRLLDKASRSRVEEARLKQLDQQIAALPTEVPEDQKAFEFIMEAASILKNFKGRK
jgi:predicted ATP-binding protein involved in virulence